MSDESLSLKKQQAAAYIAGLMPETLREEMPGFGENFPGGVLWKGDLVNGVLEESDPAFDDLKQRVETMAARPVSIR